MQRDNISMSSPILRLTASALAVAALSACAQVPPDYLSGYVQVPVASPDHPGRVHHELVPEACLVPDPTDRGLGGNRLPPGCANNANLIAMAERKRDVTKGRKLGPAPAAPSARAAQKYIYGPHATPGSDVDQSIHSPTQAGVSTETAPPPSPPAAPPGGTVAKY
jgi:hypothetical protein